MTFYEKIKDLCEKEGFSVSSIGEGHADIATTRKIYTHLRDKHMAENLDKLRQFVGSSSD